jgi:hypothetical protein
MVWILLTHINDMDIFESRKCEILQDLASKTTCTTAQRVSN